MTDVINYNASMRINSQVDDILALNNLRENHLFYLKSKKTLNINSAFLIAKNWAEITKTFLYTTISSLGVMANEMMNRRSSICKLMALQTAFSIIQDDLGNAHINFKQVAPRGVAGVHYKWWENQVLSKLTPFYDGRFEYSTEVNELLQHMKLLASEPLGAMVQIRVVEAIALDISKSFLNLFGNLEHKGKKLFPADKDKTWITAHVNSESVHHEMANSQIDGVCLSVTTDQEVEKFASLTSAYCKSWSNALLYFASLISPSIS